VSPTSADHVLTDLDGRIDAVLDGGPTEVGIESTIVACVGGRVQLLRPGGIARRDIEGVLGRALPDAGPDSDEGAGAPLAPGMLASHYAPRARVRLGAQSIEPDEAALLFGPQAPPGAERAQASANLSQRGDLVEAATNLFGGLRSLDASGAGAIAVVPIPDHGLGEAINDRLRRAAAPR
jgi:L-threonylcarbamoyladenylate synthase